MNAQARQEELTDVLHQPHVSLYGYLEDVLPDPIGHEKGSKVSVFYKGDRRRRSFPTERAQVKSFSRLSEIGQLDCDTCLLDGEAIKVLFARYPQTARYVLVRLAVRPSWILGIPGLIRRMTTGKIKFRGVLRLKAGGKSQRWLVIQNPKQRPQPQISLSLEVGVQGFLDHLREEKTRYVVLRFFDNLPTLSRDGGDLDLLVADEEIDHVRGFLQKHPGSISVDAYSAHLPGSNSLRTNPHPYYPPALATMILESAVEGPAGSRVPAPREAFLSFIYHVLYHKGLFAGVPTSLAGLKANPFPENDYGAILDRMATALGVQIPIDMESLDEYLDQEGWRPKLETLWPIAWCNEWVSHRFFANKPVTEVGLSVFLLKERALRLGLAEDIANALERNQFTIIQKRVLDDENKNEVSTWLRGGNWVGPSGDQEDFLPAMALVTLDKDRRGMFRAANGVHNNRVSAVKTELRSAFDDGQESAIHAPDTTDEAWQYIEVCFPDQVLAIREQVEQTYRDFKPSLWERIRFSLELVPHSINNRVMKFRRVMVRMLVD